MRRAVAQVIDRAAIAHKVYKDTVDPLYSMVPTGLTGHTTGFFDAFGDPRHRQGPQDPPRGRHHRDRAAHPLVHHRPLRLRHRAGVQGDEGQLEASGLFTVTLKSRPWNAYVAGYQNGEYPVFGRGWSPDFPDPDNFVAPFVGEQNALGTPYPAKKITEVLLPRSRQRERPRRAWRRTSSEAQQILVRDARLLPLWQGKQYIASSEDVSGGERALDPSTIMMMWELSPEDQLVGAASRAGYGALSVVAGRFCSLKRPHDEGR